MVFQRELEDEFDEPQVEVSLAKKTISLPEHDAASLLRLATVKYEAKYSQLFTEQILNTKEQIEKFLAAYQPIDENFVISLR